MKQPELIILYIEEHGSILPAKMGGYRYRGETMGSESSKRCRELRKKGILRSEKDGKFVRFFLVNPPHTFLPISPPQKRDYAMTGATERINQMDAFTGKPKAEVEKERVKGLF